MRSTPLFIKILVFSLIAFGPSLPIFGFWLQLLFLPSRNPEPEFIFLKLAIIILPLGTVITAYWRSVRVSSWKARGWIIFLYWQFLMLPISFLTASALSGMSMAVADGVLGGMDLFWSVVQAVPIGQLFLQILIIPWTLISTFLLRLIFKFTLNKQIQN